MTRSRAVVAAFGLGCLLGFVFAQVGMHSADRIQPPRGYSGRRVIPPRGEEDERNGSPDPTKVVGGSNSAAVQGPHERQSGASASTADFEGLLGQIDWRSHNKMIEIGARHDRNRTKIHTNPQQMKLMADWIADIAPILKTMHTEDVYDMLAHPHVQVRMMASAVARDAALSDEDERALLLALKRLTPVGESSRSLLVDSESALSVYDAAERAGSELGVETAAVMTRDFVRVAKDEVRMLAPLRSGGELARRYLAIWKMANRVNIPDRRIEEAQRIMQSWVDEGTRVASSLETQFGSAGRADLEGRCSRDASEVRSFARARLELRVRMARIQTRFEPQLLELIGAPGGPRDRPLHGKAYIRMIVWAPF